LANKLALHPHVQVDFLVSPRPYGAMQSYVFFRSGKELESPKGASNNVVLNEDDDDAVEKEELRHFNGVNNDAV